MMGEQKTSKHRGYNSEQNIRLIKLQEKSLETRNFIFSSSIINPYIPPNNPVPCSAQTLFSSTSNTRHGADRHGVEATDGAQAHGRGQPGHLENPTEKSSKSPKNHGDYHDSCVFPMKIRKKKGDSLIPLCFGWFTIDLFETETNQQQPRFWWWMNHLLLRGSGPLWLPSHGGLMSIPLNSWVNLTQLTLRNCTYEIMIKYDS